MITKFNYHYEEDNYTFKISKENGRNLVSTRSYLIRFKNIKKREKRSENERKDDEKDYKEAQPVSVLSGQPDNSTLS